METQRDENWWDDDNFIDTAKYRFSMGEGKAGGGLLSNSGRVRKPSKKGIKSNVALNGYNSEFISGVPKNLTFVRDIYEQAQRDEVKGVSGTGLYGGRDESVKVSSMGGGRKEKKRKKWKLKITVPILKMEKMTQN